METTENKNTYQKRVVTRLRGQAKKLFEEEVARCVEPEAVILRRIVSAYYGIGNNSGKPGR